MPALSCSDHIRAVGWQAGIFGSGNSVIDTYARTYIMGILNVTPDSFSGDGLHAGKNPVEAALAQARHFVEAGADILDVGGESTRPGSEPVGAQQEMERVLPVIESVAAELDVPISIDSYKAKVAAAAAKLPLSCPCGVRKGLVKVANSACCSMYRDTTGGRIARCTQKTDRRTRPPARP